MNEQTLESYKKCLLRMYIQNPVLMGELLKSNPEFSWSNKRLDLNAVFTEMVESTEDLEERLPEYLARVSLAYGFPELYFRIYTWLHHSIEAEKRVDLSKHAGHLVFNKATRELFVCASKALFFESYLPFVTFSPPMLPIRVTSGSSKFEVLETLCSLDQQIGGVLDFGNMNTLLSKLSPLVDFQNTGHSLDAILQGALRWMKSPSEMVPAFPNNVGTIMESILQRNIERVSQERQGLEDMLQQLQTSNPLANLNYSLQTALFKQTLENDFYFVCMWDVCKQNWIKYYENSVESITEETLFGYLSESSTITPVWLMYVRQDYWFALNDSYVRANDSENALNGPTSSEGQASTDHTSSAYMDNPGTQYGSHDSAYAETYDYYDGMPLENDEVFDIIACHICNNGDSNPGNQILLCDGCDGAVHQLCQVPIITEEEIEYDPWFCVKCWRARNPPTSVDEIDDLKRRRIE